MWSPTRVRLVKFQAAERLIPNALASEAVLNRAEELANIKYGKPVNWPGWRDFNSFFGIEGNGFNYHSAGKLLELSEANDLPFQSVRDAEAPVEDLRDDPFPETFLRSPNQGGRIAPKFIVLHDSYGSYKGGVSWIRQVISRVSYHYLINTDGSRTQFVWDTRRAWHAGVSKWLGFSNLNGYSIGVALSGNTLKREPSNLEIDSMARKCRYLMRKFGLKKQAIVTHEMISPGRKTDTAKRTYFRVLARLEQLPS